MSKTDLLCLSFLLLIVGCSKNEKTSETKLLVRDFPSREKFTYGKKRLFDLDVDSVALGKYNLLDSTAFINLFAGTNLESYLPHSPYNNYLYNYQDSTNLIKSITIVVIQDGHYFYLKYLTFNQNSELIDSLDIAGFGGDGDFGFHAYGHFVNDSIYQRTWTNINNLQDSSSGKWVQKNDSIISRYLIRRNGKIDEFMTVD